MNAKVETHLLPIADLDNDRRLAAYDDPQGLLTLSAAHRRLLQTDPFVSDFGKPALIFGTFGNRVVGKTEPVYFEIKADGRVMDAQASGGLFVEEPYRKTLYAVELMTRQDSLTDSGVSLNTGLSLSAQKLSKMMGFKLFPIARFALVKHSIDLLKERVSPVICRFLSPFFDCVFWLHRTVLSMYLAVRAHGWRFERVNSSDDRALDDFARLVEAAGDRLGEHVTAKWLKWVVENDFFDEARKSIWRCTKGDKTVGYCLVRTDNGKTGRGKVLEWQVVPECREVESVFLLKTAQVLLKECDLVVVSLGPCLPAARQLSKLLLRLPEQVVSLGVAKKSPLRELSGWDDPANWRIRPCVGDACFY